MRRWDVVWRVVGCCCCCEWQWQVCYHSLRVVRSSARGMLFLPYGRRTVRDDCGKRSAGGCLLPSASLC